MRQKNGYPKLLCILLCLCLAASLSACGPIGNFVSGKTKTTKGDHKPLGKPGSGEEQAEKDYSEEAAYSGIDEETYKILAENGYGEGVDWSQQTDDDPGIEKSMDVTQDKASIIKYCRQRFGDEYESYGDYEKPWWDYLPDDYDLSGDVFPATKNYAGQEKHYNNSLEQSIISDGLTSGQLYDLSQVQSVAESFIYEANRDRFKWTADMDKACKVAESLNIAKFEYRTSIRPMKSGDGSWINPISMTTYYEQPVIEYDLIGLPTFGGYKFSIDVWEDKGRLVGWIDEFNDTFLNEKEVYENMGEWDFYDNVEAADPLAKIVKPKLPNGAKILKGDKTNLSTGQYIYTKIPGGGMIYYYGNGITVDMAFFGGKSGGNFDDALKYCKMICESNQK